jgi:hypothetical protein
MDSLFLGTRIPVLFDISSVGNSYAAAPVPPPHRAASDGVLTNKQLGTECLQEYVQHGPS